MLNRALSKTLRNFMISFSSNDQIQQKQIMTKLSQMAHSESRRKNPRAFPCDQCDASYTTNQRLKFHVMRVHDKKHFDWKEDHTFYRKKSK